MSSRKLRIAIIGTGPGGICMGKRLLDEGYDNLVILEKADNIGGSWYSNTYPGCECDTPAILYSFSFEHKTDWAKIHGTQPEVLDYLRSIAAKYDLRTHCQFNSEVTGAKWNDKTFDWTLTFDSGKKIKADVVISATGVFCKPHWPSIDGVDRFEGSIWHSTQWNSGHDLSQDRVAVIGSSASAVQLVPEIVKIARQMYLFQRTPNWVLPKPEEPYSIEQYKAILTNPKLYRTIRASGEHINVLADLFDIERQTAMEAEGLAAINVVNDPKLRDKLRPKHMLGIRQTFLSNTYYSTFNEPNMELVTEPITQIKEHSIVTTDGTEREVDTIIVATGFEKPKFLSAFEVIGSHGQPITKAWQDGPIAYLGIMTSGFPNLFMIFGPNTYASSVPNMIELQVEYILAHLHRLANDGIASVDVKEADMLRYDNLVQAAFRNIPAWKVEHVDNERLWIGGSDVRVWPLAIEDYRRLTAKLDPKAFSVKKSISRRSENSPKL